MLVVKGIRDTQCGFKGFTAAAAENVFSKALIKGFGFDVEILYLAKLSGLKIKETPVEWYNDERSKVDPIKDPLRMFGEILKIRSLHRK
jgi:dolichyl-phosphate beta-glucosyltransferase